MNRKRTAENLRSENDPEENQNRITDESEMIYSLSDVLGFSISEISNILNISEPEAETQYKKADKLIEENDKKGFSLTELYDFNLIYCDGMVERVMKEIEKL